METEMHIAAMKKYCLLFFTLLLPLTVLAQDTIEEKTEGMQKYEGFFNFWWDQDSGKIWLEIDRFEEEFLYVNSLAAGVGSNDIGLDRSQLGDSRIVFFRKTGPKILMIQPNYDFRATSGVELEQKSVREAFASSVLFGFEAAAEEDGKILVDATDFLMQDAHGVADRLRQSNQGNYSIDRSRSAIHLPGTFNFPKNSEFEAMLTFTGSGAGSWLRSVAPTSEAVTVRQHHSFIELPDDDYTPREFDPRSGYFSVSYQDYSAPIGESLTTRYVVRHRLNKKNPDADISEPVEPIVYYLDNGTPEPVRTALLEGGAWWNQAFEAAGYQDAFQIRMLPDEAHPLDIRYNVINWVHRSTRGWSYGSSVVDPRTGEIIKGNVLLGSLRVRQDYMIAEGLLAPYAEGEEPNPQMLDMALNRIRQLSAHEIGHTLGISHNFASSVNDLASVMDYPHPRATLHDDGTLSLDNAYGNSIGEWDKRAVIWGYQEFPDGTDEEEELNRIIEETVDMGLLYISDEAARPQSGLHPDAHLWDYGQDPVSQLDLIMDIRSAALNHFGERNIRTGRMMAELEDVLVPIYLYHRYQTEATVKLVGGLDYSYQKRGDNQQGPQIIDANVQTAALDALLKTLDPEELALPESILDIIPPRPMGISSTRENFRGYTSPALDPVAMAEAAAEHSASLIFNPNRAARLALQAARSAEYPGFESVLSTVANATLLSEPENGYTGSIQRAVDTAVLRNMIQLAANEDNAPDVASLSHLYLTNLKESLAEKAESTEDRTWKGHYHRGASMIERFLSDPGSVTLPPSPYTPPGSPIGSGEPANVRGLLQCSF
jgi:hypothetical protein